MKKTFVLIFTLLLALSLTACGRATNNTTGNDGSMGESIVSGAESVTDKVTSGVESTTKSVVEEPMNLMAGITAANARDAALSHAGLDASQVTDVDIDLDRDNGKLIYEVDFNSGNTEYDYDIDAETGEVISADKSMD